MFNLKAYLNILKSNSSNKTMNTSSAMKYNVYPNDNLIEVSFNNQDSIYLQIQENKSDLIFNCTILNPSKVSTIGIQNLLPLIWLRNRDTNIVGYYINKKGKLKAYIKHVKDKLDENEFEYYIERIIAESYSFRYILTNNSPSIN